MFRAKLLFRSEIFRVEIRKREWISTRNLLKFSSQKRRLQKVFDFLR